MSADQHSHELVHEFALQFTEAITDGLDASQRGEARVIVDGDDYAIPKDIPPGEGRNYAVKLANTLLEETRPPKYPARSPAVWAFAGWPGETQMRRRGAIKLDAEALVDDYSLYAVDFGIPSRLFNRMMQDLPVAGEIEQSYVDTRCQEYWEAATEITDLTDLPESTAEVYIPTESISSEYFTQILTSNDGEDYSVYER